MLKTLSLSIICTLSLASFSPVALAEEKGVMEHLGAAYDAAKKNVSEAVDSAGQATSNAATSVADGASDLYQGAKDVTTEAAGAVADGASNAYQSTKEATKETASAVADGASNAYQAAKETTSNVVTTVSNTVQKYRCGEKTDCAAMTSCEEAQFFLTQCGVVSLDGNQNGKACEYTCTPAAANAAAETSAEAEQPE